MICRRAVTDDADGLLVLIERFCLADHHPFDARRVIAALGPLLESDEHGAVLVLDREGVLTGYGVVTWGWSLESGGREALIDELYVDERGAGHGSELLRALLARAQAHSATSVFLETESHNSRVRRFYARHGFAEEDSVWMARPLSG